ncbi:MAG: trimeric intracellular cation channel family protein [Clostridia bacterium]|nr:trimeric intracellular cation channel family protein [Clostridia bacterium]
MTDVNIIFQIGEWIGTAAFAVSGAMVAIDKGTDIFGVLLLAVFTALGGGTLRDVLIGYFPPRMFSNFHYVLLSVVCALAVFVIARIFKEKYVAKEGLIEQINNVFDAVGLGVFAVSGARIGMEAGFADNIFLVTFLGMTTAVGGGMLRDVLIQEIPFVLKKRVYAVAAIAGALCYALLFHCGVGSAAAYGIGCLVTTAMRLLATVFKWNLPRAI